MSAIRYLIDPAVADVGFPVQRLLPAAVTPAVGPFVFLDHMGPARFAAATTAGDVRPHPHIGLATVTYLFSGAMMHRDSLGSVQRIEPGAVNLMAAGRGIVHSERVPEDIRAAGAAVEGMQMWLALPKALEDMAPEFLHYPEEVLPQREARGVWLHLLLGEAFGMRSPVRCYSGTLFAAARLGAGTAWSFEPVAVERAVYVVSGALALDGTPVGAGQLAVLEPGATVVLQAGEATRLMLLGGDALDGPRYLHWNFVSSRREAIVAAREAWQNGRFPPVPGEMEFIPLPPSARWR
ncbi:pirin family protein [Pseudogulbenkiania sp. MAI-1]|uniref:pirin family protein n=1 Tax=Pseudogulbenkiania sp. MAI-1 TaxID=990370 RepID=UPI00045EAECC|nr:pirin family protein [Pseudogulbenkiania sp. MAI-1]